VARITRKELKTDKFALEVEHTVDFFEEHRKEIIRYGIIAAALVVVVLGIRFYMSQRQQERQQELAKAIQAQEAPVGPQSSPGQLNFPNAAAKQNEVLKQFNEIIRKYPGSEEAAISYNYLGAVYADDGNLAEAEKRFQQVVEHGDKNYASLAKLSLSQIYFAQGRAQQAEQLLREMINNPTLFVSKEQATLTLARGIAKTKPAEARKLLEPLGSSRSAVSQAALQLFSELNQ
jgi:predicted negative regulator of RcsB-dependent stress response